MKKIIRTIKYSASVVLLFALLLPFITLAQDSSGSDTSGGAQPSADPAPAPAPAPYPTPTPDPAANPAPDPVPEVIITDTVEADNTQTTDTSQDGTSPQDTDTNQTPTDDTSLEPTFDPHDASVPGEDPEAGDDDGTSGDPIIQNPDPTEDPSAVPIDDTDPDGGSVDDTDPTILDPADPAPEDTIPPPQDVYVAPLPTPPTPLIIEEPEPLFSFKVVGATIATKEEDGSLVTKVPRVSPDNQEGVVEVSGQCSDKYYVILIYSQKEDYELNPSSYIFNKAFDCDQGKYKYSIEDLPEELPDGTYYLLVGGQGDSGSWSPITALVPIKIKKLLDDNGN